MRYDDLLTRNVSVIRSAKDFKLWRALVSTTRQLTYVAEIHTDTTIRGFLEWWRGCDRLNPYRMTWKRERRN